MSNNVLHVLTPDKFDQLWDERVDENLSLFEASKKDAATLGQQMKDLLPETLCILLEEFDTLFKNSDPDDVDSDMRWHRCRMVCRLLRERDPWFMNALELVEWLRSASTPGPDQFEDQVWVAMTKPGGGAVAQLSLRLVRAGRDYCVPHPNHLIIAPEFMEDESANTLRDEMNVAFLSVLQRHGVTGWACLWQVRDAEFITGPSFTAAAAHAWNSMLEKVKVDQHLLIIGEFVPPDGITPAGGIAAKLRALWTEPVPQHEIETIVVVDDHGTSSDKTESEARSVLKNGPQPFRYEVVLLPRASARPLTPLEIALPAG